jgi:23S rRNA (guanosine2251-2'-O)-methyltransferase
MSLRYGIHAVLEELRAGGRVERLSIQRDQHNPRIQEILGLARKAGIPVSFEERSWLDRKAEGNRHQGVLCYVSEARTLEVEDMLEQASSPGLVLVLDGIEDPHNLGAVLRSAEVAGADGVLLPQRRSAGLNPTAVKASAGAASHVRIARIGNVSRALELLTQKGYWITGLDADATSLLWDADFTIPTALVLGSEGSGLHRLVKERCDFLVSIPVRGKISSLNVSVSAGIALYEVVRQRSLRGR